MGRIWTGGSRIRYLIGGDEMSMANKREFSGVCDRNVRSVCSRVYVYRSAEIRGEILISSLLGGIAIVVINLAGAAVGIHISLNCLTAAAAGVLGVPGVLMLLFSRTYDNDVTVLFSGLPAEERRDRADL